MIGSFLLRGSTGYERVFFRFFLVNLSFHKKMIFIIFLLALSNHFQNLKLLPTRCIIGKSVFSLSGTIKAFAQLILTR